MLQTAQSVYAFSALPPGLKLSQTCGDYELYTGLVPSPPGLPVFIAMYRRGNGPYLVPTVDFIARKAKETLSPECGAGSYVLPNKSRSLLGILIKLKRQGN